MLIGGASGHALEIYDILVKQNQTDLIFFDDVTDFGKSLFADKFLIIGSVEIAKDIFMKNSKFILALGGPKNRYTLAQKLSKVGGALVSIIGESSNIGYFNVELGNGLNIMNYVMISSCVSIGEGSLINAYASIHHNVQIGKYVEISPSATLLGGCKIGDFSAIGTGAIILPNVIIGENVIIGAGAVVNKDVPSNSLVAGVPAKFLKALDPLNL